MADERRRELERAAASGDVTARSALLVARLRSQELAPGRLWLAGYLRDPAALRAVQEVFDVTLKAKRYGTWIRGLGKPLSKEIGLPWSDEAHEVVVRAGVVLAERSRELWTAEGSTSKKLDTSLNLTRAWLADPTPDRVNLLVELNMGSAEADPEIAAMELATLVGTQDPKRAASTCADFARALEAALRRAGDGKKLDAQVQEIVRAGLLPWVLGEDG